MQGGKMQVYIAENDWLEKKKWLYTLSLPLMWVLIGWVVFKKKILHLNHKTNTLFFDGLNSDCRGIKDGATSWKALDIIYNYKPKPKKVKGIRGMVGNFWIGMRNAQAVRNRKEIVVIELVKAILATAKKEREVRLLSIASGSAQAVMEAVAIAKLVNGVKVKVTLIDIDPEAIGYCQRLTRENGVEDDFEFIVGSIFDLKIADQDKPHIVEMIGLLDYFNKDMAALVIKKILRKIMLPEGTFFTANICPNNESPFLKWVINWDGMYYRNPRELAQIMREAGIKNEDCVILCEPQMIHAIAVACLAPEKSYNGHRGHYLFYLCLFSL